MATSTPLLAELASRAMGGPRGDPVAAERILAASERLPAAALLGQQQLRLRELLEHAVRHVPWYAARPGYREVLQRGDDAWEALPLLSRAEILAHGEALHATTTPPGHAVAREAQSSGSTGRHVTVSVDTAAAALGQALALRGHRWHGRDVTLKGAGIRALPGDAAARTGRAEPRWTSAPNSGPLALLDVHTPLSDQLAWLAREAPAYLATYASNAAGLIELAAAQGAARATAEGRAWLPGLREIGTFGEVVPDGLRERCRAVLGVPLVDTYSSVELGHLALECPAGAGYHVQAESVYVEILRDDGTPCAPGETGRVVATALHAFVMPLLRYDLGDYATVGPPCACGRTLPVLTRIVGRQRNLLRLPTGERLWPRYGSNVLGGRFGLGQFRLRQTALDQLVLELVTPAQLGAEAERALVAFVLETLGYPFRLELRYREELPRSAGGKFEDVICELDAP